MGGRGMGQGEGRATAMAQGHRTTCSIVRMYPGSDSLMVLRPDLASIFWIHFSAWPWGSIIRGQRRDLFDVDTVTMMAFSSDVLSGRRTAEGQDRPRRQTQEGARDDRRPMARGGSTTAVGVRDGSWRLTTRGRQFSDSSRRRHNGSYRGGESCERAKFGMANFGAEKMWHQF